MTPPPTTQTRSMLTRVPRVGRLVLRGVMWRATPSRSDALKCGITVWAKSSCALIACQWSAPPALTVIETSVRPSQTSCTASIRSITSCGVPTQTMSPSIIWSYGVSASFSRMPAV